MATIVGFDSENLNRFVVHVPNRLVFKEAGCLDQERALHAVFIEVLKANLKHDQVEITDQDLRVWNCMDADQLCEQFDFLTGTWLVAAFSEDVEDKVVDKESS